MKLLPGGIVRGFLHTVAATKRNRPKRNRQFGSGMGSTNSRGSVPFLDSANILLLGLKTRSNDDVKRILIKLVKHAMNRVDKFCYVYENKKLGSDSPLYPFVDRMFLKK